MANAKQCDICGKFYAAHKTRGRYRDFGDSDTNLIKLFDLGPDINEPKYFDPITYETCPECYKKVFTFIDSLIPPFNDDGMIKE